MGQRLEFDAKLREILGSDGHLYFQPPNNLQMRYPCIVYERDAALSNFADNSPWRHTQRYAVTVMDQDPDSELPGRLARLPMSTFSRHFTSDNIHHDVYNIYF